MHEQSVTVSENGKWVNKYGPESGARAGQPLPGKSSFDTENDAIRAAVERSAFLSPDEPQFQGPLTPSQAAAQQAASSHIAGHLAGLQEK